MRPAKFLIALTAMLMAAAAQAKEFRSSDVHPLDYPTVQAVAYMGKLIGERTGGKMSGIVQAIVWMDHVTGVGSRSERRLPEAGVRSTREDNNAEPNTPSRGGRLGGDGNGHRPIAPPRRL